MLLGSGADVMMRDLIANFKSRENIVVRPKLRTTLVTINNDGRLKIGCSHGPSLVMSSESSSRNNPPKECHKRLVRMTTITTTTTTST